jgi:sulfofructosephosphate aldolase
MSVKTEGVESKLDSLRTTSGGFTMVALDQRESLREMFPFDENGALVDDDTLAAFKSDAARVLTPFATGVLLDYPLGVPGAARPDFIAPDCGLILAADALFSERGLGVQSTALDPAIDAELIRATDAAAIKFLVIWRRGEKSYRPMLDSFLALADEAGVASFVEGIVRPPRGGEWLSPEDRHDAIVEAAVELSAGAAVYKAEVPGYLPSDISRVKEQSLRVTEALDCPWVVLSNGVGREDFEGAVEQACLGGAHGFLAGRAIWADTVPEADPVEALTTRSVQRLTALAQTVDRVRNIGTDGEEAHR